MVRILQCLNWLKASIKLVAEREFLRVGTVSVAKVVKQRANKFLLLLLLSKDATKCYNSRVKFSTFCAHFFKALLSHDPVMVCFIDAADYLVFYKTTQLFLHSC